MKKAAFYTLGCRSNQYETDQLKKSFSGYKIQDGFKAPADLFVINTCLVTHDAERKSRQAIRRALREGKKVIVAGCYAKLKGAEIKELFPEALTPTLSMKWRGGTASRSERWVRTVRVRANLMIENGCENFCAYCIVPFARGKVTSKKPEAVIEEAKEMVQQGVREIILTGINLGAYQYSLTNLLGNISKIKKLLRIRLSSIEPMYVNEKLVKAIAKLPKVCHHLHIPLQTGDDKLLSQMGRTYSIEEYEKMIKMIRKYMPDCGITTDLIVGLPGETEAAFKNTLNFVKRIKFYKMHIFPYSKRAGTRAAEMKNQVDDKIKKIRCKILNDLNIELMREFEKQYFGKLVEVLVEKNGEGLTGNFIRVKFNDEKSAKRIGSPILLKYPCSL